MYTFPIYVINDSTQMINQQTIAYFESAEIWFLFSSKYLQCC